MTNLLDRRAGIGLPLHPSYNLTAGQSEQDQLSGSFIHEASDWRNLSAMMAGGLTYRLGKVAVYSVGATGRSPLLAKFLAPTLGLATEVTTFRGINQILSPHPSPLTPHSSWFTDYLNFATLKLFGNLAQGQNSVLAHFFQDAGMVAGHQLAYSLNLAIQPEGSLIQQFAHAEATNIALAAGTSLAHRISGGKLLSLEKALEAQTQSLESGFEQKSIFPELGYHSNPVLLPMAASERLGASPSRETEQKLRTEWDAWPEKTRRESSVISTLDTLLPHYARFAQAHLGKETAPSLPFIQEVYEMAKAACLRDRPDLSFGEAERSAWIHFLSSQEGRKSFGEVHEKDASSQSLSRKSLESTREVMGKHYAAWEKYAQKHTGHLQASTFQKAQIYQRSMALMHFYVQAQSSNTPFRKRPFEQNLAESILNVASKHPYPSESIEIFIGFFREVMKQSNAKIEIHPFPKRVAEDLEMLPVHVPDFLAPQPHESWADYLTRAGLTRGKLREADLGVAGVTIFSWGSSLDDQGRMAPPGDITDLLGVVTYLNTSHERGVDPFEAARLTLPDQLKDFTPDRNDRVVIRYPKSMEGLDYAHFGLGAFLRAHLRSIPEARDLDLAAQWEVSEGTVAEYRRGVVRKMRLETLEKMARNFSTSETHRIEMFKFLMFLRYRAYFDATVPVHDSDGSALNHKPPYPSRVKVVLMPHEGELRPPDLTQRIRFEREPFASVMNGSVDYALQLLEQKIREFNLLAQDRIALGDESCSRAELQAQITAFRDQHTPYFQILDAQEKSPGVVRPGELREMQEFYRNFFRFFERIYLHALPQGSLQVGAQLIHFKMIPSTHEQTRGVSFKEGLDAMHLDAMHPVEARVVATDLLEKGAEHPQLHEMLKLRIAIQYLHRRGILQNAPEAEETNKAVLRTYLAEQGFEGERADALLHDYYRLEADCATWAGNVIDPSENAILHKITRGHLAQSGMERRKTSWAGELQSFIQKNALEKIQAPLQWLFSEYLQRVQHPYLVFDETQLNLLLAEVTREQGAEIAGLVRSSLLDFMKILGLATENVPTSVKTIGVEGFANATFATYLKRFQALHTLRGKGPLLIDAVLLDQVVEERLTDFPHLNSQKESIARRVEVKIEDYNRRQPLLKVYEVARTSDLSREAFAANPQQRSFEASLENFRREFPGQALPSHPVMRIALGELRETLSRPEQPSDADLAAALQRARIQLEWYETKDPKAIAVEGEARAALPREGATQAPLCQEVRAEDLWFLKNWIGHLLQQLQSLNRLAELIPAYVLRERYESGLDPSPALAREIVKIHREYVASVLLDAEPISLSRLVAHSLGNRFEAYPQILADVARGIHVIYHASLAQMRLRYQNLELGVELSLIDAREHKNKNRFLASARQHRSEVDPALEDMASFRQHVSDLEVLMELSNGTATQSLVQRFEEASKEVTRLEAEAKAALPRIEATELLKGTIPSEFGDPCSEIHLVKDEQIRAEVDGNEKWKKYAVAEARALVHLAVLLQQYRSQLSAAAQDKAEEILMDIETSGDPLAETTRRAFEEYQKIQAEVVSKIPPLDYAGTLPEIRNGSKPVAGEAVHFAIHGQLSKRALPRDIEQAFQKEVQSALARTHSLDENYFVWLTSFYLQHRARILAAAEIRISPQEMPSSLTAELLPGIQERLQREFPELAFVELEEYKTDIAHAVPIRRTVFEYNAKGHELLLFHALMHRYFASLEGHSALHRAGLEMLNEYTRLFVLAKAGGSVPHLLREAHTRILEIYRKNHADILVQVAREVGPEKMVAGLPEIQGTTFDPTKGWAEISRVKVRFLDSAATFQKVIWRLQRGITKSNIQRELEALLWNFEATNQASEDHEVQATTVEMQKAVYLFYLKHRSSISQSPALHAKPIQDSRNYDAYWELNAFPVDSIQARQTRNLDFLATPLGREMPLMTRYKTPDGVTHELLTSSETEARERLGEGELVYQAPFTPLHRMYTAVTTLINPKVRALMNEALDYSKATREVEKNLYRAMSLLYLGVDPAWVMDRFQQRVLDYYHEHREAILAQNSFAEMAVHFEEIRGVPDYEVQRLIKMFASPTGANPVLSRDNEFFIRLYALVCQSGHDEKAVNEMLRGNPPVEDNMPIEQVNENAARYYLKNMKSIFQKLRPWVVTSDDHMLQVKYHPLISNVDPQDATDMSVAGPRKVDRNSPDYDLMTRIVAVVEHPDVPQALQVNFRRIWNAVRPQTTESITRAMVNFFIANEDALNHAYDRMKTRRP